jgi:hypothetical protein
VRRLSVPTLILVVALTSATACRSDSDNQTTAASSSPAVSTVTAPPSTLVETVEPTAPPRDPGAPQDTDASPAAPENVDVCAAATGALLLAALKSSPDFYRRVAHPTGLGGIQCSPPFALGFTQGTVQGSGVLFRREGSRWTVLDVGSAMDCAQYGVTAEDALEGCVV